MSALVISLAPSAPPLVRARRRRRGSGHALIERAPSARARRRRPIPAPMPRSIRPLSPRAAPPSARPAAFRGRAGACRKPWPVPHPPRGRQRSSCGLGARLSARASGGPSQDLRPRRPGTPAPARAVGRLSVCLWTFPRDSRARPGRGSPWCSGQWLAKRLPRPPGPWLRRWPRLARHRETPAPARAVGSARGASVGDFRAPPHAMGATMALARRPAGRRVAVASSENLGSVQKFRQSPQCRLPRRPGREGGLRTPPGDWRRGGRRQAPWGAIPPGRGSIPKRRLPARCPMAPSPWPGIQSARGPLRGRGRPGAHCQRPSRRRRRPGAPGALGARPVPSPWRPAAGGATGGDARLGRPGPWRPAAAHPFASRR